MSTWSNTQNNFTGTWNLETTPSFSLSVGGGGDEMLITPRHARGLVDDQPLAGTLDAVQGTISIVFELRAAGLAGGHKQLLYVSAATAVASVTAGGPVGTEADWAGGVDDFDGTWGFPGGGQLVIQGGHVQCIGVNGIADGLFQAQLSGTSLVIRFILSNNGYVGGDPSNAKEITYSYPEPLHTSIGTPTEGERYEEMGVTRGSSAGV